MIERVVLQGERVRLEPLEERHISEEYVQWFNDPDVCRYNRHGSGMTREKVQQYVQDTTRSDNVVAFAVIARDRMVHVGNISLQKIDRTNNSAEYAIIIGNKDYWGKGIAYEASALLLGYGFEGLELHRIYCGTSTANVPMQKLAERLGFVREGVRREAMFKNGEYSDIVEFGLLKKDHIA